MKWLALFAALILTPSLGHALPVPCETDLFPPGDYTSLISRDGIEIALRLEPRDQSLPDIWIGSLDYTDDSRPFHLSIRRGFIKSDEQMLLFGERMDAGKRRHFVVRLNLKNRKKPFITGVHGIEIETAKWLGLKRNVEWKSDSHFAQEGDFQKKSEITGAAADEIYRLLESNGVSPNLLRTGFLFRRLYVVGRPGTHQEVVVSFASILNNVQLADALRGLYEMGLRRDHLIFGRLTLNKPGDG